MDPRISVIVPAHNEERFLPLTLGAIQAAAERLRAFSGENCELIVVDNGCSDGTAGVAEAFGARVIPEPQLGIARARNAGGCASLGSYLVFVDADTLIEPGLLIEVHRVLSGGRVSGGSINLRVDTRDFWWRTNFAATNILGHLVNLRGGIFYCTREAFDHLGGFDEAIEMLEDVRFFHQLRRLRQKTGRRFKHISTTYAVTSARKLNGKYRAFFTENGWHVIRMFLKAIGP